MLSSPKHQRNQRVSVTNKNKILNKVSSFTSSSPSSSSSSSPSSPLLSQDSQAQETSLIITMEEVWEDINLASIHHLNHHSQQPQHNHKPQFSCQNQNHTNSIFQDFLNRPTIPTSLTMASSSSHGDTNTVTALFSTSPLAPPPATVLSLNSASGFEFLDNQDPLVTTNSNHLTTPFEALVTSTCFGKKRSQESNEGSWNRRHKRMIKNRESAARSRARKQAYTYELELEIAHLQAENAKLKRQQDQLKMAATNQQPKKNKLQRSSTAPF